MVTWEPHSTENDFCKERDADKIKDQKETKIIPHPAFPVTSTSHSNALSLPQTRERFNIILANAKIYDLGDNGSSEEERSSKVLGKIANEMRMKRFLKNKDCKKHKYGGMLDYVFFDLIY